MEVRKKIIPKVYSHSFSIRLSFWMAIISAIILLSVFGVNMYIAHDIFHNRAIQSIQHLLDEETKQEVVEKVSEIQDIVLLVTIVGIILILLFSWVAMVQLARPVRKFAQAAENIAAGDFNTQLPNVTYHDELYQLRYSLNEMQQSLAHYVADLKETTEANTKIENELAIAGRIQMNLLPKKFPPYPELTDQFDLFASLTPAKEVGGDLYDFILIDDLLYFAIGDVSGKGVPAAMFMAITRSLFQHVVHHYEHSAQIAQSLNRSLTKNNKENMFVTLFIGVLDITSGKINYCNAGHDFPILLNAEGANVLESVPNIPLGVMRDYEFHEEELQLELNDSLFLYTDGITEALDVNHEMFGIERLTGNLRLLDTCSSRDIVNLISESVKRHSIGEPQTDDMTLLNIKWKNDLH